MSQWRDSRHCAFDKKVPLIKKEPFLLIAYHLIGQMGLYSGKRLRVIIIR